MLKIDELTIMSSTTSPGYKGYYHAMYDKYFHSMLLPKH